MTARLFPARAARRALARWSLLAATLLLLPGSAWAVECWSHIEAGETTLTQVREEAKGLDEEKRARVELFLADAAKLLERARTGCSAAQDNLDKAKAAAWALVAQGHLAAAHLLIQAD